MSLPTLQLQSDLERLPDEITWPRLAVAEMADPRGQGDHITAVCGGKMQWWNGYGGHWIVTYNAGSRNLSTDFFDISVY